MVDESTVHGDKVICFSLFITRAIFGETSKEMDVKLSMLLRLVVSLEQFSMIGTIIDHR